MKRLELDFAHPRPRRPMVWVLLAAALVLALDALVQHAGLAEEVEQAERPWPRERRPEAGARALDPGLVREMQHAERVLQRLSLPWEAMFQAVESAANPRVALLALAPDAGKGEVRIAGEAAAYADVLAFVDRLGRAPPLRDVHLARHEVRQDDPQHPLLFTIVARWGPVR